MTGIELVHVPYRGAPAAMQAVVTNDVQLYLAGWGVGRAFVESGKARALAVASERRLPNLPDLPTAHDSVPGFIADNWWGLAAPAGTPAPVVARLHEVVLAALREPATAKKFDGLGFLPGGETPAQFAGSLKAEAAIWAETIRRGRLAVE
jgi:tripartite-type tricarboxylate transporter receptor subunit TctC